MYYFLNAKMINRTHTAITRLGNADMFHFITVHPANIERSLRQFLYVVITKKINDAVDFGVLVNGVRTAGEPLLQWMGLIHILTHSHNPISYHQERTKSRAANPFTRAGQVDSLI
jgi:hypothetical protein